MSADATNGAHPLSHKERRKRGVRASKKEHAGPGSAPGESDQNGSHESDSDVAREVSAVNGSERSPASPRGLIRSLTNKTPPTPTREMLRATKDKKPAEAAEPSSRSPPPSAPQPAAASQPAPNPAPKPPAAPQPLPYGRHSLAYYASGNAESEGDGSLFEREDALFRDRARAEADAAAAAAPALFLPLVSGRVRNTEGGAKVELIADALHAPAAAPAASSSSSSPPAESALLSSSSSSLPTPSGSASASVAAAAAAAEVAAAVSASSPSSAAAPAPSPSPSPPLPEHALEEGRREVERARGLPQRSPWVALAAAAAASSSPSPSPSPPQQRKRPQPEEAAAEGSRAEEKDDNGKRAAGAAASDTRMRVAALIGFAVVAGAAAFAAYKLYTRRRRRLP